MFKLNELKVFHNGEFGELGVLTIDGKEYFPATQCAKVLGYAKPADAVKKHCKGVSKIKTPTNDSIPSERTFRRELKKIPDCIREYTREGKKSCFDKYCEYIDREYTDLKANEIWIADNHTLDIQLLTKMQGSQAVYYGVS